MDLSQTHLDQLQTGSGIDLQVIVERGYRSASAKTELEDLGFSRRQARVHALVIPVWGVSGEIVFYQARPDTPRVVNGKTAKYETPKGTKMALDVHPRSREGVGDPNVPLFITEGIKKGDSLVSHGCCTVTLPGVWSWRGTNPKGGKTALPDWDYVALNERQVYICFDSDVVLKPEVHKALSRLKGFLELRGAKVAVIYLPPGPGGKKVGVDDFFIAGHSVEDLMSLATSDLRTSSPDKQEVQLREIYISGRHMREVSDETWEGVSQANHPPQLFQMGRLATDIVDDDNGHPKLRSLDMVAFRGKLDRVANFIKETSEGPMPAYPPKDVSADMLAYAKLPLPILRGIVHAPVFSSDGEIITTPGYQAVTGSYLHLDPGLKIPPVPEFPTTPHIAKARQLLIKELLGDFPFVSNADLAHAVAAQLQMHCRRMISGQTPGHLIESPTPGSGKGLLASVTVIPALGREPATMAEGGSDEEWRKRITAKLLEGPQVILIDNISTTLNSAALSSALTAPIWEDRVLGYSRIAAIPVDCLWLLTANNPSLSLEIARRMVPIRIDPEVKQPWKRTEFNHPDLKKWAMEHRGELIWAGLVLIKAWVREGMPSGTTTLGSFESWSKIMGGILEVSGISGFLGNLDRVYEEAEHETAHWAEFCAMWWEEFADMAVGTDLLFGLALRHRLLTDIYGGRNNHSGLTRFGMALSKMRDRIIGEYRILRSEPDSHSKRQRYRLELRGVRNVAGGYSTRNFSSSAGATHEPTGNREEEPGFVGENYGWQDPPQPSATLRSEGEKWEEDIE